MTDMTAYSLNPGEIIGGYTLINRLGSGGMGTVWQVRDDGGNLFAMKILRNDVSDDSQESDEEYQDTVARERLRREAVALHSVNHKGVCHIEDMELDDSLAFIVTELIEGTNLREDIKRNGRYIAEDLERLASKLIDAVDAVHEANIIHRDIKPTNVMISPTGPVLVDFGIAMEEGQTHVTSTGLVMGTPGFIAPEVIDGAESDEATDWWSTAAVLAFAATGRPIFGTHPMMAVLEREMSGNANLSGLPPRTAAAFRSALNPDRELRCSAQELLAVISEDAKDMSLWEDLNSDNFPGVLNNADNANAGIANADNAGLNNEGLNNAESANADTNHNYRKVWNDREQSELPETRAIQTKMQDSPENKPNAAAPTSVMQPIRDGIADNIAINTADNTAETGEQIAATKAMPESGNTATQNTALQNIAARNAAGIANANEEIRKPRVVSTQNAGSLNPTVKNPFLQDSPAQTSLMQTPAAQPVYPQPASAQPAYEQPAYAQYSDPQNHAAQNQYAQNTPVQTPADPTRVSEPQNSRFRNRILPVAALAVPTAFAAALFPAHCFFIIPFILWLLALFGTASEASRLRRMKNNGIKRKTDTAVSVISIPWHMILSVRYAFKPILTYLAVSAALSVLSVAAGTMNSNVPSVGFPQGSINPLLNLPSVSAKSFQGTLLSASCLTPFIHIILRDNTAISAGIGSIFASTETDGRFKNKTIFALCFALVATVVLFIRYAQGSIISWQPLA